MVILGLSHASGVFADPKAIRLEHAQGTGWILEVKSAPLIEVFGVLSERMGIPIVSPTPPGVLVTLRCTGGDIRAIVSCLLGSSGASVMYHGRPGHPDEIVSVRILASSFVRMPAKDVSADPHRVAAILEMTRSEDSDARADGYTRLAQLRSGNETIQRGAFRQGLSDPSGEVRAAALLGLHGVDPEGSREQMMNGLRDSDGNVRLAALDVLGQGPDAEFMLKQALNDTDELVRELARMRLGLPDQHSNP